MNRRLLGGMMLAALLLSIGCHENNLVKKPDSFEGEFNPSGAEVGVGVGKLAPEIKGKDLDGVEFKLSDYRGKVVMLDFWGDW